MRSPNGKLVTIFGGSGFIGRHVARALAKRGYRVRAAVRRPDLALFLAPMGVVGQVTAVQANLRYPDSVARAIAGADVVINLVGVLAESGKQTFEAVQATGAETVAKAAAAAGVSAFIQMSAIGADAESESAYARSKAQGEAAALAARPDAIIVRPSIVFGPEDSFFNRFAAMARFSPALPLIGGGETKLQPVFVGDVAEMIARAVDGAAPGGRVYELGGPDIRSFRELMEFTLTTIERRRLLVPVPWALAMMQAQVLELLPGALLTTDQVRLLQQDNIVSAAAVSETRTLEGLGVRPSAIEAVVPSYLWRFRKAGQFEDIKAR
ncbi:MAG: complex I NDUFA9 subunit family protein [Rhizobiales bacterium 65-9]|nr:complex I NDUFA9 subunit family protein [Hyphomicrobiales bacterium]OJY34604.1 MAG: complex I NDUFA9 subunit family protein [Rhizobiales bacterium 65-9]